MQNFKFRKKKRETNIKNGIIKPENLPQGLNLKRCFQETIFCIDTAINRTTRRLLPRSWVPLLNLDSINLHASRLCLIVIFTGCKRVLSSCRLNSRKRASPIKKKMRVKEEGGGGLAMFKLSLIQPTFAALYELE